MRCRNCGTKKRTIWQLPWRSSPTGLVSVAPDKVGEATLQQIMTSAGIAIDKMQLLRQQPTSIEQKQPGVTIYLPDNERNSD